MRLNEMIFSDGKILEHQFDGQIFRMKFLDYSNNKLEIRFSGDVAFEINEGAELELSDSKLGEKNNLKVLELLNAENFCVFRVQFNNSDIKFLTQ